MADPTQLQLAVLHELKQRREVFHHDARASSSTSTSPKRPPRNGAVVTAPGPPQVVPGSRYAPAFGIGVAVAKYADHLPLERQVRMMARDGLIVDSQTLWDQINAIAHHLEPTYAALGRLALEAPVINVDETRWAMMGSLTPAKGTAWTVRSPAICSSAGRDSRASSTIRACRLITTRPKPPSAGQWSVGRITTAHDRSAAPRSRLSSTPCARRRSWRASTRTRICSMLSLQRSHAPAPSRILKTP